MGLDLQNDYDKAKSKISAFKTTVETKKNEAQEFRQKASTSVDKKKSDVVKQISELENKTKEFSAQKKNEIKSEVKNQLEQMMDLLKETFSSTGSTALTFVKRYFLEAAENTKPQIKTILTEEIINTLGCSEEQS